MFISEAEYEVSQTWVKFDGYQLNTSKTLIYGKSRLIALVHRDSDLRKSDLIIPDDVEILIYENNTHRIVGTYRPFTNINNNNQATYFEKLLTTLGRASRTTKRFCAGGDLNVNYSKNSHFKDKLEEWAIESDLTQHINVPTWERIITTPEGQSLRRSRLDLVFASPQEINVTVLDKLNSDHNVIMVVLSITNLTIERRSEKRRDYRKYSSAKIHQSYTSNLQNQSFTGDPDFDSETITECMMSALDEICPLRTIRTSRPTDVLDQCLEKAKKKRKRILKKFNKTGNVRLLTRVAALNKAIKNRITSAKKHQIDIKLEGKNPKCFWNTVGQLEGKNIKDTIKLNINGNITSDPTILVEEFANFFQSKVNTLSNNAGQNDYSIGNTSLNITTAEVIKAARKLKNKLCAGEDGIPMKIVKDIVTTSPDCFRDFFNDCSKKGIPSKWKLAIITPLFKAGDREQVTQYRPISNLDSLSKVYERVVLGRLNAIGDDLDGTFQHGFKENRSTVTAMLEIQDFVASNLDKGNVVGTYSLDLSAAFDLLRPDIFLAQMNRHLPNSLLQTLMDFLSNRQFKVQIGTTRSQSKNIKVGCVQGSILGPRLFTLYMKNLPEIIREAHLVSFADDSYISVAHKDIKYVKQHLEQIMTRHESFLTSIGMVTNVSKTELIFFARKPLMDPGIITVNGTDIVAKPSMKILGIMFDQNLGWVTHLEKIKIKARYTLLKMKYLSKYLNMESMKKVITSHFFGMLYYGAPVWLTEALSSWGWNLLNILHYKALRVACSDYRRKKSRLELDTLIKRARPHEWMKYINAKTAIQLTLLDKKGPPITAKLRQNFYKNDRTGKVSFMDTSRLKIGKNSLQNRLLLMREVPFDWTNGITPDRLRIELKKTFIK